MVLERGDSVSVVADGSRPCGGTLPSPGKCGCISPSPVEGCTAADAERPEVAMDMRGSDAGVLAGEELDEVLDPEEAIALESYDGSSGSVRSRRRGTRSGSAALIP